MVAAEKAVRKAETLSEAREERHDRRARSWTCRYRTVHGGQYGSTSPLVPFVTVTGRSVVVRTVTHCTPRNVVSACTPPECVMTTAAPTINPKSATGLGAVREGSLPDAR